MDRLNFLMDKSNSFSKKDINSVSEHLFSFFEIDYTEIDKDKSLKNRSEILELFIGALNKALYSDLVKEKKDKVEIVSTINQLKLQQELFELLSSDNPNERRLELMKAAERFGKKSQSSV